MRLENDWPEQRLPGDRAGQGGGKTRWREERGDKQERRNVSVSEQEEHDGGGGDGGN